MVKKICIKCQGTGFVNYYQGNCINGERCYFTTKCGARVENCVKCGRRYKR